MEVSEVRAVPPTPRGVGRRADRIPDLERGAPAGRHRRMTETLDTAVTPKALRELAAEVRAYLRRRRSEGAFEPHCDAWADDWNPAFSQELAERGWVGMTIPVQYGGRGRTHAERFVVAEEILAAGAPVAAHWVTERQIAPQLIKLGSEDQRQR